MRKIIQARGINLLSSYSKSLVVPRGLEPLQTEPKSVVLTITPRDSIVREERLELAISTVTE